jgi:hypothetical protein
MSDPNTSKLRLFFITAVVAIAAIASFWYLKEREPADDVDWMRAAACPEHKINIQTEHGTFVTSIPVAPNIATIPEFHDCQRFLVKPGVQAVSGPQFGVHASGVTYGPLVAIWVGEAVDTLFQGPPGMGLPPGGDSGIVDSVGDSMPGMGSPGDSIAYAVAQIHSWGPATYEPLRIQPGFSCLYMWRDSQAPYLWRAMIVWTGARPDPCHDPERIAGLDGAMLEVRPVVNDEFKKVDIPPVARWDRDLGRGDQYIGIKCGSQWCEIGRPGFASSSTAADEAFATAVDAAMEERPGGTSMTAAQRKRVLGVKGWYDQQMLATFTNNTMGPSGIVGTIIPHPLVQGDQLTAASFEHTWVQVAFVHVSAPYVGKHLELAQGLTELHFCKGTADQCGVPVGALTCATTPATTDPDSWWVRLTPPEGPARFRCIKRDISTPPIPAGAARWRWLEDDETTWVRCEAGCCTTQ